MPGGAPLIWIAIAAFALGAARPAPAGAPLPLAQTVRQAPPAPPPIAARSALPAALAVSLASTAPAQYSIGDPTAEEQLYLELINRARANPPAEGLRLKALTEPDVLSSLQFFGVDLDLMVSQFALIAPAPPLSMDSKLIAAARVHSQDMFDHQFQGHTNSFDNGTFLTRISNAGYFWLTAGENVFAYADSVQQGHAGFEIDWGLGLGGMQTPPGHRNSIHNPNFREIGVGVVDGQNGSVGPQVVTEDFATIANPPATPFITGVVYYDLDGDNFYSLGEGVGGVTVTVQGNGFYAVTANSGGYSVPVPGDGVYDVSFSGEGFPETHFSATVTNNQNVKVDFVPQYQPPLLSGPAQVILGQTNIYQIQAVPGAVGYQAKASRIIPGDLFEGAEGGSNQYTLAVSPGYPAIDPSARASGTNSFLLAHVQAQANVAPLDQYLYLKPLFWPGTNSVLSFQSELVGTSNEVAEVQASSDGGQSWANLWTEPGDGVGETSFHLVPLALTNFVGNELLLRFNYAFNGGGYFPASDGEVGWHIDDIRLSAIGQLVNAVTNEISGTNGFILAATARGNYLLEARPNISNRYFSWGPGFLVSAVLGPLQLRISSLNIATNSVRIRFQAANTRTTSTFVLESSADLAHWNSEPTATLVSGVSIPALFGQAFEFSLSTRVPHLFYRIEGQP